ncbi:coiled-coil domain-containing protein 181 [Megalops cyprinoides]|uniref:coiled-coil domain-containing protein 181 n=1 Tax=Megalops cyprinoides TaxID=118141 RepID=UPI0018651878|nr:coiled-coil domain-containing protein 181 [Megalops cyprinoides]
MSGASGQNGLDNHAQEEYEDDFEKDLDWLISEEGRSEEQDPEDEDIEAQIDKELEEEEERARRKQALEKEGTDDERWPSPMEPYESVSESDGDSAFESLPTAPPLSPAPPLYAASPPPPEAESLPPAPALTEDEELEEEKRRVQEKIQLANQQLKAQEAPDHSRRRRLQFKDTLVDLVVPPLEYEHKGAPQRSAEEEREVSGRMSELQISLQEEDRAGGAGGREGRVLIEKDGKFDLVSLREVESQGLLPPLPCSNGDGPRSPRSSEPGTGHSRGSASSPRLSTGASTVTELLYAPKPPPLTRSRPNSAGQAQRSGGRRGTKRRVQSANNTPAHTTFTLTPEQKQLQIKLQQRRERLRREEEERRREEEEQKRQENELAFQAWLLKKREQLQEDRRILRAQEMEKMSSKREQCDPQEAFKLWLRRKQEQQVRERQLEEMRRLEEESVYYLRNREESERAFKLWLRRKQAEKKAEMRLARERSRRMMLEARRARRMQDLLCTVNEAKSFHFADHYGYRF